MSQKKGSPCNACGRDSFFSLPVKDLLRNHADLELRACPAWVYSSFWLSVEDFFSCRRRALLYLKIGHILRNKMHLP